MKKQTKIWLVVGISTLTVGGILFAFRKQIFKSKEDKKVEEEVDEVVEEIEKETKEEVKKQTRSDKPAPKKIETITLPKTGKKVSVNKFMGMIHTYMKGLSSMDETSKATALIRMVNDLSNKDFVKAWKAFGVRDGDDLLEYYTSESFHNTAVALKLRERYVDLKPLLV